MRRRAPLTIVVAAAAATALLVGCIGPAGPEPGAPGTSAVAPVETGYDIPEDTASAQVQTPSGTTQTPTTEQPSPSEGEVFDATVRVEKVLSGDTMEVTVLQAQALASDPLPDLAGQRITVKNPMFDAPAEGECGFEESKAFLESRLSEYEPKIDAWGQMQGATPPPFKEGDGKEVMLKRLMAQGSQEWVALTPAQDGEGRYLLALAVEGSWLGNYHPVMYGFGRLSDGLRAVPGETDTTVGQSTAQSFIEMEERAKEVARGLWATCWK